VCSVEPGGELIGRERELAAIASAIDTHDGGGRVCIGITGELGIGKTRLLDELRGLAGGQRLVLHGRATEFEQQVPFALAIDALDAHLGTLTPGLVDEPGEEHLSEPAVRALLERLAERAPVVLLLDDLQWADQASLGLIRGLLEDPVNGRLMIAMAYRPRRLPPSLKSALASSGYVEIKPRRLTEEQAGELLGDRFDPPERRALYRESRGNPFYLEELARGSSQRGLPEGIRAVIEEELSGLTRKARELLQAAAVVGERFDVGLARTVAGLSEVEARAASDELLARELVLEQLDRSRMSFSHPVLRRAVYEASREGSRIEAHGRAAAALVERPASLAARAHHLERSAMPGDEQAISALSRAGHASLTRAPATAARWLEAALRLLSVSERERRLDLLVPLATARGAVGSTATSRAALAEALELIAPGHESAGDAVVRGEIVAELARLDHAQSRFGAVRAPLEQALDGLDEDHSAVVGVLEIELAVDHWLAGELNATALRARHAVAVAEELGDRVMLAEAQALLSLGELSCGATVDALRSLDMAEHAVGSLADSELRGPVRTLLCLAHACLAADRSTKALDALGRALRIAHATGQSQWLAFLHAYLGMTHAFFGRLAEAEAAAQAAIEAGTTEGSAALMWAWALRSGVARLSGDLPGAVAAAERALDLTDGGPVAFRWLAGCQLGAALIETGEPESGRGELLAAAGGPELTLVEPAFRTQWYEVLADAELGGALLGDAEEWVGRCERTALRLGRPTQTAVARRARAGLLLAGGDAGGAARLAEEAADGFAERGAELEAARSRVLLGRALGRAGERVRALEELEQAHTILEGLGALRYRDQAARELRLLGRRMGRRAEPDRAGPGVLSLLSKREHQVAQLASAGRTNRAIAAELFISEKTVETYLSRAFAKLGVSSRTALAAATWSR
jgi:DNA-binding CsgD family transcriptional regulator